MIATVVAGLLAGLFLLAGVLKLADMAGVRQAVATFGFPDSMAGRLAWGMVAAEFGVAASLILGPSVRFGALGALVLLLSFTGAIAVNLVRGNRPQCHCFGRLFAGQVGWSTVVRNIVLAAPAGFLVTGGQHGRAFGSVAVTAFAVWVSLLLWQRLSARGGSADLRHGMLDALIEQGRPLVLVFSQPSCPACAALEPEVARWQRELAGAVTVAVVSGGPHGDSAGAPNVLIDTDRTVFGQYGITATPSAVLVDPVHGATTVVKGAGRITALIEQARTAAVPQPVASRRAAIRTSALWMVSAAGLAATACDRDSRTGDAPVTTAAGPNSPSTHGNLPSTIHSGDSWICDQAYALCTTAQCEPIPGDPSNALCRCVVETGYSMGTKTCDDRIPFKDNANTLTSTFSTQNMTQKFSMLNCSSQEQMAWANCLDMPCEIDPLNPALAHCTCPIVRSTQYITFGGGGDLSTCTSVLWSGAAPDTAAAATTFVSEMAKLGLDYPAIPPGSP